MKTLVPPLGDDDFWNIVKLWAMFVRIAGRPGLVLVLDEARLLAEVLSGPPETRISRGYAASMTKCRKERSQGWVSALLPRRTCSQTTTTVRQ